jgi:phosphoglycolate phosphatase-like HAD superfamily hydrolase
MTLDIPRIRGLCFDVDGTLSDTDDHFVNNLLRVFNPFRFFFPNQDPRPFARWIVMTTESPGNILLSIPDRLGIDDELAVVGDSIYRLGLGKSSKPFLLVPGVQRALEELKSHFPLSVVTARGARTTQMFLDQFELTPNFEGIASAQTCEHTKPFPDPILWAADKMNVAPEECLMIGDTTVDIKAAKAAGAQSVGVLCGFGTENELRKAGADMILDSTALLPEVLLNQSE